MQKTIADYFKTQPVLKALHLDYSFDGGYLSIFPSTGGEPSGSGPIVVQYGHNCHYYIRDHQGNNRLVVDGNGNEEQINDAGPVDCLDGKNPNPFSAYSSTQKAGVYIHRSNNNGWAGTNFKKKTAVSTGCLLIVPSKYDAYKRPLNNGWNQFNEKLFGVKSFKLILRRK